MGWSKDDYLREARNRRRALQEIATTLGYEKDGIGGRPSENSHMITRMMGSMAYGRGGPEQGGSPATLRTAIREAAWLDGFFDGLKGWAAVNDRPALNTMMKIWRKYEA